MTMSNFFRSLGLTVDANPRTIVRKWIIRSDSIYRPAGSDKWPGSTRESESVRSFMAPTSFGTGFLHDFLARHRTLTFLWIISRAAPPTVALSRSPGLTG